MADLMIQAIRSKFGKGNRSATSTRQRPNRLLYKWYVPYLFLTPFFAIFVPFGVGSVLGAIGISFVDWRIGGEISFVGLDNYAYVLGDSLFRLALSNTLQMFLAYIAILIPIALLVAVSLNQPNVLGYRVFQVSFFLPITMSLIVVAMVFDLLYDQRVGLLNGIVRLFGQRPIPFLTDPVAAPWSIIALRVWRVVGYYSIILFAGLQTIPRELYEAAEIDGAGPVSRFRFVTLPLLRPVLLFVIVAASIGAWELFAEPWVLTQGGPMRSTLTAVMYIYRTAFLNFDLGHGAAAAGVLAVVIVTVTLLQNRFLRRSGDA